MIFTSRYPETALPKQSLREFIFGAAAKFGDEAAYIDGQSGERLSFRELGALVPRIANGLIARGLRAGDRVLVVSPNSIDCVLAYHAVAAAGGAIAPVNALSTAAELGHYLDVSGARFVLVDAALAPVVAEACRGRAVAPPLTMGDGSLARLAADNDEWPALDIDPHAHVVALPFSSGTTGLPKGVMLTHANVIAQCLGLAAMSDGTLMHRGDVVVGALPFFHIYGIVAFMTYSLHIGATVVIMRRFDLQQYLTLVQEKRVTFMHVVPPIVLALASHPLVDKFELGHVRAALCAAAPLGIDLARAFTRRLGIPIMQAYGMTELTGASHLGAITAGKNRPDSAGLLLPGVAARIVSLESGADLGPGEQGEICVRGPIVMRGYLDDAQATDATIDADGWLHTGDVGHADGDGNFWVVDRVKELIKYKGMQIAPAELEDVLLQHPAIADAAVIAAADDEAGEIAKAIVVVKAGCALSADEVMAHVAAHVSPQKKVRAVRFVTAIPRAASGKILRRQLRQDEVALRAPTVANG